MATETVVLDHSTDEKVENKLSEEIKVVEQEGVSPPKESGGTEEEEKSISDESASSKAPVSDLEEKIGDNQIDPPAAVEVAKFETVDDAPASDVPVEDAPNVVEILESKPDISAVSELKTEAGEKELEEQPKVPDVPGSSVEATDKPVEHSEVPTIQEPESEAGEELEEVSKSDPKTVEIAESAAELKETAQELSEVTEEVENSKMLEPEESVEGEIQKVEGTLPETVEGGIDSLKEEQTSQDQELISSESLDIVASCSQEALGAPKENEGESLLPIENAMEDTKKVESHIDVVEGELSKEAAVEVGKVEEVKEEENEKEKAEEAKGEKNVEVEKLAQPIENAMEDTKKVESTIVVVEGLSKEAAVEDGKVEAVKEENGLKDEEAKAEKNVEVEELAQPIENAIEDTKKVESEIDVVEGLSNEAAVEVGKVEEVKEEKSVEAGEANGEKNLEVEELAQPETTKTEDVIGSDSSKEDFGDSFETEKEENTVRIEEAIEEKNVGVQGSIQPETTKTVDVTNSDMGKVEEEKQEKNMKVEEVNEEKNLEVEELIQPETTKTEDVRGSDSATEVTGDSFKGGKEEKNVKVDDANEEKNVEVEELSQPETTKIEDVSVSDSATEVTGDSFEGGKEEKHLKVEDVKEEKNVEVEELPQPETTKIESVSVSDSATEVTGDSFEGGKEEKSTKVEEASEEKNVEVEELTQIETPKTEDVDGSNSAAGVTGVSLEEEKASRDIEMVPEYKKVETGKDDIGISVETTEDRDAGGKVDVVNSIVNESIRELKESELEVKAEEALKSGIDNLEKAEEVAEEIAKSVAPNLEPSKDGEDLKTDGDPPKQEVPVKSTQKQSNSIMSKVKQSIVKVKKAIIGKSPSSKTLPSETKGEIKVK